MISEELLDRLESWIEGEEKPPYKIILFPTSRCNLNCRFCKSEVFLDDEISKDDWLDLVDEAIGMSVEEWWITGGGEPLMRKDLTLEIIRRIKNNDKYCDLMTNGTLLDLDTAEDLVSMGVNRILISLDGPDADTNDFIRGGGTFRKIIDGIKNINKAKERANTDIPRIQLSSVINSKNYHKINELFELARELEVDELELHQMLVYDSTRRDVSDLVMSQSSRKKLSENIEELELKAEDYDIDFNGDAVKFFVEEKIEEENIENDTKNNLDEYYCVQPFYTMLIDMLGEVAPCCPGGSSSEDVNLFERGLEDVWYGDYFNNIREKVMTGKLIDFCSNCGVNNLREDLKGELDI